MSLNGTLTLVFIMASALAGCGKSPGEAFCAKSVECGTIQKSQEEQCVASAKKASEALADDEGCKKTVESGNALTLCVSGLSCEELKSSSTIDEKCADELAATAAAYAAEAKTCTTSTPGSSSSSSGGGAGGGGAGGGGAGGGGA
jgi:uncharacterized membrane protein YgcG